MSTQPPVRPRYQKPWLAYANQMRQLVSRGLVSEAAKLGASFAASWEPLFRRGPVGNHSRLMGLGEAAVITYWPPPARESGIFCNRYRQSRRQ